MILTAILPCTWAASSENEKEVYSTNCPIVSASNGLDQTCTGSFAPVERTTGILFGRLFPPPHPCARGHPQDQAPEEEKGTSFWDVEL